MQIAAATIKDARAIAEIHVAAWRAAYAGIIPLEFLAGLSVDKREAYWREEITRGQQKLVLAKEGNALIGWASYGASRDEDAASGVAEIWAIYVAPRVWSSGVGRQLWWHAQTCMANEGFRSVSLWVLATNARAIAFYSKMGFLPDASGSKVIEIGGQSLQEVRFRAELPHPEKLTSFQ